jgi:hypothetical protein
MSKHELLKPWPIPELVRNMASFVSFLQFYSKFIPHFEIRVEPFRRIMEQAYTEAVGDLWTPEMQATFNNLRGSILCNLCLRRFNPRKITVLRTDFLAKGFGYVVLGWECCRHVGNMSARQPNVGTFGRHSPVMPTQN